VNEKHSAVTERLLVQIRRWGFTQKPLFLGISFIGIANFMESMRLS